MLFRSLIVECEGELPGLLRREGRRAELRVAPGEVQPLIDRVRAQGGSVLSVVPHQKNLEQVLLSEVERARPVDVRSMGVL